MASPLGDFDDQHALMDFVSASRTCPDIKPGAGSACDLDESALNARAPPLMLRRSRREGFTANMIGLLHQSGGGRTDSFNSDAKELLRFRDGLEHDANRLAPCQARQLTLGTSFFTASIRSGGV